MASNKGSRVDIRLPSVSSTLKARQDLRKTMAGVGSESPSHAHVANVEDTGDDDVYTNGMNCLIFRGVKVFKLCLYLIQFTKSNQWFIGT